MKKYYRIINDHIGNIRHILQQSNVVIEFKNQAKKLKKENKEQSLTQCQNQIVKDMGYENIKVFYEKTIKEIKKYLSSPVMILEMDGINKEKTINIGKDYYGLNNLLPYEELNKHIHIVDNMHQENNLLSQITKSNLNLFVVNNSEEEEYAKNNPKFKDYNIISINDLTQEVETIHEEFFKRQIEKVLKLEAQSFDYNVTISKNKPTKLIDFFNEKVIIIVNVHGDIELEQLTINLINWLLLKKVNRQLMNETYTTEIVKNRYKQDVFIFKDTNLINPWILGQGRSVKSSGVMCTKKINNNFTTLDKYGINHNVIMENNTNCKILPSLKKITLKEIYQQYIIKKEYIHKKHNSIVIMKCKIISLWR